jgi:hypothetical protein
MADKDMDDHACDDVVQTTEREGTKLAWLLYRSRGHHLIELNIQRERLMSTILLSPTTLEFGQLRSALQFAMQAERAEVYGLVQELYLQWNADAKRITDEGGDPADALLVRDTLRDLIQTIEKRGVCRWPWAWREPGDVEQIESTLSVATDDGPDVPPTTPVTAPPPPPAKQRKKRKK